MSILQNAVTWFIAVSALTGFIPALLAVIASRSRRWELKRTKDAAKWFAAGLSILWWVIAVYGLRMHFPYTWVGATLDTSVQVLAFLIWCLSPTYLAPTLAEKIYSSNLFRQVRSQ